MNRLVAAVIAILIALSACDSGSTGQPRPTGTLNVNQATVEELEKLPGIGPKRARSIIASRNARGGAFTSLDELLQIDGIGEVTLDRIRGYVEVGPPRPR